MNQPTNHNSGIRKYLVWLFWIAVWQAANLLIHNNIIFVGPLDMIKALAEQAADPPSGPPSEFLCQNQSWFSGGLFLKHPSGKPGLSLPPGKGTAGSRHASD